MWDRIETEYRAVLAGVAERLDALGSLAPGVDAVSATDLLWTINHPDTWHLLVRRCGWIADRYEQWAGDILTAQLLGVPRAASPGLTSGVPAAVTCWPGVPPLIWMCAA